MSLKLKLPLPLSVKKGRPVISNKQPAILTTEIRGNLLSVTRANIFPVECSVDITNLNSKHKAMERPPPDRELGNRAHTQCRRQLKEMGRETFPC